MWFLPVRALASSIMGMVGAVNMAETCLYRLANSLASPSRRGRCDPPQAEQTTERNESLKKYEKNVVLWRILILF